MPQGKDYEAYFTDAGGITPGNDVNVSGIKVGKVTVGGAGRRRGQGDVHRRPRRQGRRPVAGGDQDRHRARPEVAGGDAQGAAGESTSIPLGRTTTPYTLNTALQDLGGNASELDKPQFEQALQTLTDTLRDATPQLRGALDGVADLSRSLNKRDEALEQLLAHAKRVSDTLAQRSGQVNQLITDGNLLFAALDERRQALSNLIAGIDDVSQQLSGFVADNQREFGPALEKLNLVMDNLLERTRAHRRGAAQAAAVRHRARRGRRLRPRLPDQPLRPAARDHRGSAAGHLLPAGQAAGQPRRLPARVHLRAHDHQAEVAMTEVRIRPKRARWLRARRWRCWSSCWPCGVYLVWPSRAGQQGRRATSRRPSACTRATTSASSACRSARSTRSSRGPATSRSR